MPTRTPTERESNTSDTEKVATRLLWIMVTSFMVGAGALYAGYALHASIRQEAIVGAIIAIANGLGYIEHGIRTS